MVSEKKRLQWRSRYEFRGERTGKSMRLEACLRRQMKRRGMEERRDDLNTSDT